MSTVKLISSDNISFVVPKNVAAMSSLIGQLCELDSTDQEIPIQNVKGSILEKVIDFCKFFINIGQHHVDSPLPEIEKPLKSEKIEEAVPEWDSTFIKGFEQDQLMELVLAANYLEVTSLIDLRYVSLIIPTVVQLLHQCYEVNHPKK